MNPICLSLFGSGMGHYPPMLRVVVAVQSDAEGDLAKARVADRKGAVAVAPAG